MWDAVSATERLVDRQAIERLVQRGPSGLHALVGEVDVSSGRRPPTDAEFGALLSHVQQRQLYPLVLLDLPPATTPFAWTALGWSIAPVVVARASRDSVQHTMRLLKQLRLAGLDAMASSTVVVVTAVSARVPREVRAVVRQVRAVAGEVVTMPYDSGLARPDPVEPRSLNRATRVALVEVAAAVLRRCPADPQLAATVLDQSQPDGHSAVPEGS